ncbi:Imm1 family immunity protein [Actinokineospora sp.]|uniref:Imm1 family immunity protein n=1 Tax=Actinokineospora sp. TaxID=1872133 RepID=UPI004037FD97
MVELAVWYDQDEDQDEIVVRTVDELNTLIDRVLAETTGHRCPAAIQVNISGQDGFPILEVGLGQDKGFIRYYADVAGSTKGDGDPDARAEYIYMSNLSVVPADVEVDIQQVRSGLIEFLETGKRPAVVRG